MQEANKQQQVQQDNMQIARQANSKGWGKVKGWGLENYPYFAGWAYIECDEMKCTGCGVCQMACSVKHFGVINKELSSIRVRKYLLPLPKAVQMTCVQCPDAERECEKACPVESKVIYFDKKLLHMVIDEDRCLGLKCLKCQAACPAKAVMSYPMARSKPFVCDLCDTEKIGDRNPQCANICPYGALHYTQAAPRFDYPYQDSTRKHEDVKAEFIAKRLYPLTKESMWQPKEK